SGDFPIRVGARIINEQNKVVAEPRWQLGAPLRAGEQRQFDLTLTLPSQQGNYQVNWDLVEEKITWFGKVTGENVQTTAHITGSASAYYAPSPSLPSQAVTATFLPPDLSRLQLWKLAFQMWRAAPLLGVGLDNFRLTYGTQLGQTRWNDTLHTNNWYVETLVSFGLLAGLTFFAGQAFLLLDVAKSLINFQVSPFQLAIACAITAFYIHGLLDYFLLFNATGLLFWLLVGCWLIFHNKETRLNDQL
ncbi:MAG TPA: O-antigen ligase family protein, partial [Anaerolineae bacterium]|nr:O-antigen ligase family protein [Anaerolineae bacterium]